MSHEHEEWQMRESENGELFCATCGEVARVAQELHGPVETGVSDLYWKEPDYCPTCREYWPCETYRALKAAVEGGHTK